LINGALIYFRCAMENRKKVPAASPISVKDHL
jgi:hypothetical protein